MDLHKRNEFLKSVLSYVKFSYDRDDIRLELEDHILDKMDKYIEAGYGEKEAEEFAINDMGDPREIGVKLNKEHNPIVGWLWRITNFMVGMFIVVNSIWLVLLIISSLVSFTSNPMRGINKADIVYKMKISEKVQIDDTIIKFTDIVYDKQRNLHIAYKYYDKKLFGSGWSLGTIGTVKDDLGNEYFSGSGSTIGGFTAKSRRTLSNFSKDANTLIIDYDEYNRKYKVEIPLKTGDAHE